ncbi:MAG TPA: SRPBCC domain-containing protein [Chitinophagaceae bacterium]|jgi:uncharacterized protein YndB with AHSA1/START domain|nr:SRPBCC domain-containing protein [Chitinophagaceae bacterium]
MLETNYTRVGDNKLLVEREFDSSVEQVWKAWTETDILDQWWAPLPFKAVTVKMDFNPGGQWLYYMEGPDGARHYCTVTYDTIEPNRSFSGDDGFCDENGNINKDFPVMKWNVGFAAAGSRTKVDVEITFNSEDDLNKIVEMGFKEGFRMAHENLDRILQKQPA